MSSAGRSAGSPGRSGATGGSGYSAPRSSGSSADSGATSRTAGRAGAGAVGRAAESGANNVPDYARPRDGHEATGTAVPRGSVPGVPRGGTVVIVPGGYYGGYYDPWWYGPGYTGSYGGYYDPWYGGYPSYYPQGGGYGAYQDDEGLLRLKIKPREAEVYVDGYFVGVVDEFDGVFQRLHIESGVHRVEIRAPGYEPLVIDVRISADHLTTYQGELKRIP